MGNSKICPSLGLFAGKRLEKGDLISVYSGEKLHDDDGDNRGTIQDEKEETYVFTLDKEFVIDAWRVGNLMRYSNHSENEMTNSEPKIVFTNSSYYIIILIASKTIFPGQEILFNYNF